MGVQFPPAAPSLSGDILSINRFLKDTPWVMRALRSISDEQLVGDKLLTANITTESGSIGYEQNESIYADRPPQPVSPGGEYPVTPISTGPASTANTVNWGNDALITDVSISRQKYDVVGRSFRKLMNSHVMAIDTVAISAVASSVTQNTNAIASWGAADGSTVKILRDLMRAATSLTKLKQGYKPNAVFVEPDVFANVVSDDKLMNLLPKEYPGVESSPVRAGLNSMYMRQIGGFTFITSPNAPASGKALVCDTTVLGGFANEFVPAPGYVTAEDGLQVKTMREDGTDGWRIRARRITVPVVLEPGAGWWINGVNA
ncbi:major head protein [Mycobacterium phage BigNuz]|uniref:Major capsid protein n=2 Tax=Bignuzvirus bignuz TaxID=1983736 RepID=G1JX21_9CAUD|nr:major head protein [Mycobacterium phage BigNuz]AEL98169.1 major capsid protein [Mycobacterium phage BigNuz]AOT24845.1 major capsid protein [Mycobacterium phage Nazo]